MDMHSFLLDVVETPWLEENKRAIWFFSILAVVAISILLGIFIYRRKQKSSNNV